MATSAYNCDPIKTFIASGAIEANRLVIFSAANTVRHAVAGEDADGSACSGAATGEKVTVRMRNAGGTAPLVASGAITLGDYVYADAAGKVTATRNGSGLPYGKALTTVTTDGDSVEVETDFVSGGGLRFAGATVAASTALTNSTTATAFSTAHSVPANKLQAGDFVRIRAQGIATATNSTDTLAIKLFIGATEVLSLAAVDVADNDIWVADAVVAIRTAGSSGTCVSAGFGITGASGTGTCRALFKASQAIDTTVANSVFCQGTWSVASASNSCRLDLLTVEVINGV